MHRAGNVLHRGTTYVTSAIALRIGLLTSLNTFTCSTFHELSTSRWKHISLSAETTPSLCCQNIRLLPGCQTELDVALRHFTDLFQACAWQTKDQANPNKKPSTLMETEFFRTPLHVSHDLHTENASVNWVCHAGTRRCYRIHLDEAPCKQPVSLFKRHLTQNNSELLRLLWRSKTSMPMACSTHCHCRTRWAAGLACRSASQHHCLGVADEHVQSYSRNSWPQSDCARGHWLICILNVCTLGGTMAARPLGIRTPILRPPGASMAATWGGPHGYRVSPHPLRN